MNKELQTVLMYHDTTKHSQQRYARSLGYMDWATQPNPFREYQGAKKIKLPLALSHATIPYSLLDEETPAAPLLKESLSQLLQFSMAIAAWKTSGDSSWAVRCNASSGNLHPTESYLILPPVLSEQNAKSSLFHYAPKNHELELLAEFQSDLFQTLPDGTFLLGLSSIPWREAWKYGERAFRYTQLDAGHAWQSIVVSAKMLGWNVTRLDNLTNEQMSKLLGLNQNERFFEAEHPDMILAVSPQTVSPHTDISALIHDLPALYDGIANKLSPTMYDWDIIPQIVKACEMKEIPQEEVACLKVKRLATKKSKEVLLNRRSVHVMKSDISTLTAQQFHTVLKSVDGSLDGKSCATHLCLFVHRVAGYKSGLYLLVRDTNDMQTLKSAMHSDFVWEKMELENLYLLAEDDFTFASKGISCSQDIASDGSFSLGMLSRYWQELQTYGTHRYKELYWECGAIGQQLYLEATSLGLSGTGIGCFLDDTMHALLGLKDNNFQILYHFTVGRGFVDSRIMTKPAYGERE